MKQNQTIVKALAALAIAFGVQNTASAQFGGLLKKAKQKVENKVNDTKSSAVNQASNSASETTGVSTNTTNSNECFVPTMFYQLWNIIICSNNNIRKFR